MNEDRRIGQRAGIRWAVARLRKLSEKIPDPDADLLKAAARILTIEARALRNEDADDIAAGLEALKEPVVATWPEVRNRLGLRDAHLSKGKDDDR